MHVVLVRYAGLASRAAEAAPVVERGFVPVLRDSRGFLGYAAIPTTQGDIMALTIWGNSKDAEESRERNRTWVRENLGSMVPEQPTERFAGDVMDHAVAAPHIGRTGRSLYCMVREYSGVPPEGELQALVGKVLKRLRESDGFSRALVLRDPHDSGRLRSVAFFGSRESAERLNREITQAAMPAGMTQRLLGSGETAVAAFA